MEAAEAKPPASRRRVTNPTPVARAANILHHIARYNNSVGSICGQGSRHQKASTVPDQVVQIPVDRACAHTQRGTTVGCRSATGRCCCNNQLAR